MTRVDEPDEVRDILNDGRTIYVPPKHVERVRASLQPKFQERFLADLEKQTQFKQRQYLREIQGEFVEPEEQST